MTSNFRTDGNVSELKINLRDDSDITNKQSELIDSKLISSNLRKVWYPRQDSNL